MKHIEAWSAEFAALAARRRTVGADPAVRSAVADIVDAVRREGDEALCRFTNKFDRYALVPDRIKLSGAELDVVVQKDVEDAIAIAVANIRSFHEQQMRKDWRKKSPTGGRVGEVFRPVDRAGIYVPGGTAPLLSSVLMSVIPAQVAGVSSICVVTPPGRDGKVNAGILAACRACCVREVYRVGGAQAIAALAYGTKTVRAVDVIAGPGNAYVTEAKRQMFGTVGIDLLAGPSESMVIIDDGANPAWIAADVLSQAEHHASATYLVSVPGMIMDRAEAHIAQLLATKFSGDAGLARAVRDRLVAVHANSLEAAAEVANAIAPEHLQIDTCDNDKVLACVKHAGAVFLGPYAPVPLGDFAAGPSHVLPTGSSARFMSGLSTDVFRKRMAVMEETKASFAKVAQTIETFGTAEYLPAHAYTAAVRRAKKKE